MQRLVKQDSLWRQIIECGVKIGVNKNLDRSFAATKQSSCAPQHNTPRIIGRTQTMNLMHRDARISQYPQNFQEHPTSSAIIQRTDFSLPFL